MKKLLLNKKYLAFYILYSLLFLFVFLTIDYADGRENAYQGYRLTKALFNGNFVSEFNASDFSYGIMIYFIYAIWSIPVVLIETIFKFSCNILQGGVVTLWYKCLLSVFFANAIYWFNKILKEFYIHDKTDINIEYVLLFISSGFIFIAPFAITQCDVIGMSISLMGVYFLMKKQDKKFLLAFSIAITMKYLALILFIPLVLYRVKKIRHIITYLISGVSLSAVSLFICSLSERGRVFMQGDTYVSGSVDSLFSGVSLPIIGNIGVAYYAVICIIAYLYKTKDDEEYVKTIPWLGAASWLFLFVFNGANLYWYILIMPYLFLILLNRPEYLGFGIFLEIIYTNMIIFIKTIVTPWVFGGFQSFQYMILKSVVPKDTPDLLYRGLMRVSFEKFDQFGDMYKAISFVAIFALVWLFRFNKNNKNDNDYRKELLIGSYCQLFILLAYFGLMVMIQIHYLK